MLETITSTAKGLTIMIVAYCVCFVLLGAVVGSMIALFKFGFNTALNLLS
jgi:hypothetical protein